MAQLTDSGPALRLFERPVVEAVAILTEHYLSMGREAIHRVGRPGDTEALHDFRVALRRCRVLLRAYRPWLGKAAGKRMRGGLGRLMRATSAGRDTEVQIVWLEARRPELRGSERTGLNYLLERLQRRRQAGHAAAAAVRTRFERLDMTLGARLAHVPPVTLPFGRAFATRLGKEATVTAARLATITNTAHGELLHDARLAVKRLRYLVEPLTDDLPDGTWIVAALKRAQDVIGELNDSRLLARTVDRALVRASEEHTARLRELAIAGREEELANARRRDERFGLIRIVRLLYVRRGELLDQLRRQHLIEASAVCASLQREATTLAGQAGGGEITFAPEQQKSS